MRPAGWLPRRGGGVRLRVTASAPGRCGIVGNPSDIYGGFVVSCSVPHRNSCTLYLGEAAELAGDVALWNAAVARAGPAAGRAEWTSQVPRSSGLAGSTALLAAMLACLTRPALASDEDRSKFAELVRDVELREAGVVCGYQDAYMAVHGGLQAMDFAGKHPVEGGQLGRLEPIDAPLPFLLITTGVERLSGSVHGPIRDRWLAGDPEVVAAMTEIARLGREGAEALKRKDWNGLGSAMDENHRLVAALGGSGEAIDDLIRLARECGATAAKLAGAGLGGTVIALAEDRDDLRARLAAKGCSRFLVPEPVAGLVVECQVP